MLIFAPLLSRSLPQPPAYTTSIIIHVIQVLFNVSYAKYIKKPLVQVTAQQFVFQGQHSPHTTIT
jgi:hypothetical protein